MDTNARQLTALLGKLHLFGYCLLVGSLGQGFLLHPVLSKMPAVLVVGVLCLPWLTIYAITCCKRPPCGPRRFRHCLVFAMGGYAFATLLVELLFFLFHSHDADVPTVVARLLTACGFISFFPFVRTCRFLRRAAP